MPPEVMEQQIELNDADTLRIAKKLIGITNKDNDETTNATAIETIYQLALPLSMGGFGLTPTRLIAPAAYLAAMYNSIQKAPVFASFKANINTMTDSMQLTQNIDDAINKYQHSRSTIEYELKSQTDFGLNLDNSANPTIPQSARQFIRQQSLAETTESIQSQLSQRTSKTIFLLYFVELRLRS